MFENFFHKIWYEKKGFFWCLLWPLSIVYGLIIKVRKYLYEIGFFKSYRAPCKVIIVGNQTIGGGGKTPMVIALVELLESQGYSVGVICKGYKGSLSHLPQWVDLQIHTPFEVGDEAILLKQKLSCPVVAANNRVDGAKYLLAQAACDIIISDDGLTHLALKRDFEIILENKKMGLGNGSLIPAGPLREKFRTCSIDRLFVKSIDLAEFIGDVDQPCPAIYRFPGGIYHLHSNQGIDLASLQEKNLIAIAAIAHPQNFFETLHQLGLHFHSKAFPDHYAFKQSDFSQEKSYIMTEKDAVKCRQLHLDSIYVLKLSTYLSDPLKAALKAKFSSPL